MPIVSVQLPEHVIKRFEAYGAVCNRSLPEMIEMTLVNTTITQFPAPVAWLPDMNGELYAQQVAREDHEYFDRLCSTQGNDQ